MSKIKKGDQVKILLGKDRGKVGKVLQVLTKKTEVVVEGVNLYKRHVKKTAQTEGRILDITKAVDVSNIALVCPLCKQTTKAKVKVEGGVKVRVCQKCGKEIK